MKTISYLNLYGNVFTSQSQYSQRYSGKCHPFWEYLWIYEQTVASQTGHFRGDSELPVAPQCDNPCWTGSLHRWHQITTLNRQNRQNRASITSGTRDATVKTHIFDTTWLIIQFKENPSLPSLTSTPPVFTVTCLLLFLLHLQTHQVNYTKQI